MFQRIGQFVARRWALLMILWGLAIAVAFAIAPPLESVEETGEFAFLPDDSPSLVAERLFARAFPNDAQASTVAVIARRANQKLTQADLDFIDNGIEEQAADSGEAAPTELSARLRRVIQTIPLIKAGESSPTPPDAIEMLTFQDRALGPLLLSPDGSATLVLIELPSEFLDSANRPLIDSIEHLLFEDQAFQSKIPAGLELALSGTAVVGRDMLTTARDSAKATEHLTIILVIVLLILIYRAPLLALVPLTTVFLSVGLAMKLLCWMAEQEWVTLFTGIESYVTVLVYGAGVDYCLFLIARYKEEIDRGIPAQRALEDSIGSVGAAIAASAGTVICGIGMMIFAEFGKFRDAGVAISFGLVIVLIASLTLTPALLRAAGTWVFWPQHKAADQPSPESGAPNIANDAGEGGWLQSIWDHVAQLLLSRAWMLWLISLGAMLPFALVGVWFFRDLSYGLLSDLPETARSVVGTQVMKQHFPDGLTGPITVLIESPEKDFQALATEDDGIELVTRLHQQLLSQKNSLELNDLRSVGYPLGGSTGLADISSPGTYRVTLQRALANYVGASNREDQPSHVTRLELITNGDPFDRDSIPQLNLVEAAVKNAWKQLSDAPANFYILGPTASIRDLKNVTDRDQIRIDLLATVGVFLILVALLRKPAVCVYLILSVLLSYLATLGVTYLTFWAIDGDKFAGLDWKVPMFLFTILIAVGEDYNIFLMSRVEEEQARLGRLKGISHALSCTGRIISSCGIIMAGTFASLAAGSLRGMAQLGFALAFGVLLDTFVVRPILVPAYLVLVESGAFGPLSYLLGKPRSSTEIEDPLESESGPEN